MAFMELKDKVPPHNVEAEAALLGSLLLDNKSSQKIDGFLRPEDFYRLAHQKIYRAALSLIGNSKACDLITLTDELRAGKDLDLVGGSAYISQLTQAVPSSANIQYYAKIVKECSLRRELIRIGAELSAQAFEENLESNQILEQAEKNIFSLALDRRLASFKSVKEIIPSAVSRIEKAFKTRNAYTGVPSGFDELDSLTSGFQESDYIVIGARPSVGKTAFALSMAANISIHKGIPTGFFTLEMPDVLIMERLIAMEARVDSNAMRKGLLKPSDISSIMDTAGIIYEAPLWVSDWPNMPIMELRSQARSMVKEHGVKIIFIDYLGLISAERPDLPRWEQFGDISRSLKALARELKIPVVILSQVTRDTEGKEPSLANIRESGSIEQDADVVMFLHRDRNLETEPDKQQEILETKLIIAKQRNGPIGTVKIGFRSRYTRFESYARGDH